MSDKIFPIGIQNFEKLRKEGYFYVDKTALIYKMVKTGSYYFLSRPRRFGKSLLVSTLEAYFQGKKELFEGLAMEQLEKEWTAHPVLHLDLNAEQYDSPESLVERLNGTLEEWERLYGRRSTTNSLPLRFENIIRQASEQTGRRVVILVDEYDKPMLQAIDNEALQTVYRDMMKAFYSVLKSMDGNIRFALLTGVTKLGKVSVFSDLNNLQDISMDERYVTVCGMTEEEIHTTLEPELYELAATRKLTYVQVCKELKNRYDGYHFVEHSEGLYNPFSLLNTFAQMKFGSYWFETGTPTYLIKLLQAHHYDLERLAYEQTDVQILNSIDNSSTNPVPVIYQSGYLTIKGYDEEFGTYRLGFPNEEVEEGFMRFLLPYYTHTNPVESPFTIQQFVQEVRLGDYDGFFHRLKSLFADTPYTLVRELELHYQNVLFIVFKLMGFYTEVEYHTSRGRVDLVLKTERYIYVMEFKLNGSAEEALHQIEEKGYVGPFMADSRTVYKVGVNFSSEPRNIEKWLVRR